MHLTASCGRRRPEKVAAKTSPPYSYVQGHGRASSLEAGNQVLVAQIVKPLTLKTALRAVSAG